MKNIDLGQWISVSANLGVIAGIVLLAWELRQNSEAAELQAAQAYVAIVNELDFRLAEESTLVAALLAQADDRSPVDAFQVERFMYGTLRTWENGYYLNLRGALDDELWSGQVALTKNLLTTDIEFRQYWNDNRVYLSAGFNRFLDTLLATDNE